MCFQLLIESIAVEGFIHHSKDILHQMKSNLYEQINFIDCFDYNIVIVSRRMNICMTYFIYCPNMY